jgi:hypothetical protein
MRLDLSKNEVDNTCGCGTLCQQIFGGSEYQFTAINHASTKNSQQEQFPNSATNFSIILPNSPSQSRYVLLPLWYYSSSYRSTLTDVVPKNLPLIFVAHSFGGIIVKEALVQISRHPTDEQTNSILSNVLGILAFAVPSTGLDIASLLPIVRGGRNEAFLRSLEPGAEYLKDLEWEWEALVQSRNIAIFAFYELMDSPTAQQVRLLMSNMDFILTESQLPDGQWRMVGPVVKLVRRESAVHGVKDSHITPINQNHSNVIKFKKRDETYNKVREMLDTLTDKSKRTQDCI